LDGNTALINYVTGNGTLGTAESPHVIKDYIIDAGGSGTPIGLNHITLFLRIINCTLYNCGSTAGNYGLNILNSNHITIENCTLLNNPRYSINVETCSNITINNCTIFDCSAGIYTDYSSQILIEKNTIRNLLYGAFDVNYGQNINITNNKVNSVGGTGIWLRNIKNSNVLNNRFSGTDEGLIIDAISDESEYILIKNNHFNNSASDGFLLQSMNNCNFTENIVFNATYNGLKFFGDCLDNNFYYNAFVDCKWGPTRVSYSYTELRNSYDNGSVGNFWGDYQTRYPDATAINGIWNTPYVVNNTERYDTYSPDQQDNFPLESFGIHGNFKPVEPGDTDNLLVPNFWIVLLIEFLIFIGIIFGLVIYIRYQTEIKNFIESKRR